MNTITLTKHRKSRQITKKYPSSVSDQMAVWNCRVTRHCMQVSSEESGRIWRFSLSPVMAHLLQQSALEWSGSERCARTVRTFRCQYHSLWGRSLWLFYCPWWHHIRCRKSTLVVTFHPRFPVPVQVPSIHILLLAASPDNHADKQARHQSFVWAINQYLLRTNFMMAHAF